MYYINFKIFLFYIKKKSLTFPEVSFEDTEEVSFKNGTFAVVSMVLIFWPNVR